MVATFFPATAKVLSKAFAYYYTDDVAGWCVTTFCLALAWLPFLYLLAALFVIDCVFLPFRVIPRVISSGYSFHRRNLSEARAATEEQNRLVEQRSVDAENLRAQESSETRRIHREEVRFRCQLLYEEHRWHLMETLPPDRFEQLLAAATDESCTAELCESRAAQLEALIQTHSGERTQQDSPEFDSPEAVVAHYQKRRNSLRQLGIDRDTIATLEVVLDEAQENAIRKFLT